MQYLLLLITAMLACVASAIHVAKRVDNPLVCTTPTSCVNSYTTGNPQCASGYERTNLKVPGFPIGSICERPCNDQEKKDCAAVQCIFYKAQCALFPEGTICGDAISWCYTPIKTTKENCVQVRMRQPVKYDDATGTCAAVPEESYYLRFRIGRTTVEQNLFLSCHPLTNAGTESIINEMKYKAYGCRKVVTDSPYTIRWLCNDGKERFDKVKQVFKDACAVAAHPGDTPPTFESNTN